jgi:nucleoid DNA-binding protein
MLVVREFLAQSVRPRRVNRRFDMRIVRFELERGMRVEPRGRGALIVRQKRARQGRYPRTGQALMLRARRAVCFPASALLRRRLNCIRIDRSNPKPNRRQLPLPIDNESQGQGRRQTLTAPPLEAEKAKETGPSY